MTIEELARQLADLPKRELVKVLLRTHEIIHDEMVDPLGRPIHEPATPGDCDRCGTTYAECTRRILRNQGACCPACRTTEQVRYAVKEHHPGIHTWESWSRRNHA